MLGIVPTADMQCVSRIVSILGRASEKARLQSIRAFFEREISLERMRKILSGESMILPDCHAVTVQVEFLFVSYPVSGAHRAWACALLEAD